jgi:hypothetical protein
VHGTPHAPQLTVVRNEVSQPLPSRPSQFSKPALHVEVTQLPVEQLAVALARMHVVMQPAQLVSVLSGVSQPLASAPSQLAKPDAHAPTEQVPVEQSATA